MQRLLPMIVLCTALSAHAADVKPGKLSIQAPWARATVPGARTGGAFLSIENAGASDRLISGSTPVAGAVELHAMSMEAGVMKMQKLDRGVELPAGKRVELTPGGLHIMLFDLKTPLKQGDRFPLKLRFEKAGEISVEVRVEGIGATAPPAEHKH